ncbi:Uncharacterised protein [Sphingobacterium mizutaii]|uniref:CarboxypepD_reg-like domain-containing protein n=1 Tax=Sphingobacterium mizutaii TaxID=1010 RepID=A0AAJ5C246_9SPHI|nr:DUF5686 family protein [Sphingobacterium mizutaii]SDL54059.1 CarboxypepD_reg-like domain-containing protein [Sphingobacterium mizutaii]SNV63365.1 Uncharacterised protein [Sphingobacterium mizutaii]
MRSAPFFYFLCAFVSVHCFTVNLSLAQTVISGKVLDKDSKQAVAGATILDLDTKRATSADNKGFFSLSLDSRSKQIEVRALGFRTLIANIPDSLTNLVFELTHDSNKIEAVSISHKSKYRNRNNKAVELIDLVIRHKHQNRLSGKDSLEFDQYDKLKFGFIDPKVSNKQGMLGLGFLFGNIDSTSYEGKKLLSLYLEESNAKVYGKKDPPKFKKIITSHKKTEFDRRYVNNPNIQEFLNYMFQQVDVYDESIYILNKQFLSPIADNGKLFYKYYITDTIFNEEGYFIQLKFEPRNKTDLLFNGILQVSMDGTYAVKKANLKINEETNLNWVKEGEIVFHYEKDKTGVMLMDSTRTFLTFGIRKGETVFADRISINDNYRLGTKFPINVFSGPPTEILPQADITIPNRPIALNNAEQNTYRNIETLNQKKSFKTVLALGYLLSQGFYNLGMFEIGPLEYLYSQNNIEGNRFRIGGRSTQALTDKAYFEGYVAYGLDDARLKYFLRSAVSLNGNSVVTFPAHYIEGSVQNDIMEPGQQIGFLKGDSFFRSIRRNRPTKWFDTRAYQLQHVVEFGNHFSVTTGFTHRNQNTVGDLRLINSGNPEALLTHIQSNEAHVDLRWAPFEKFYYRNLNRKTIIEKHPVFNLTYTHSLDGFWNTTYAYDKLTAAASKRFFLNQLGFADLRAVGGRIWGTLPYTMLELPNVKQREDRHEIDFDMMNPMEFVADSYLKVGVYHQMQGFLFNKIPLIKKLNLREVWGAQMFYGKLSDQNNPYISNDVVEFDRNKEGEILTNVPNGQPYWEGTLGIDNILNVLKVEYVRRLNYNGLPNVRSERVRFSININF